MIKGSCHCGAVHWSVDEKPQAATACSCTICRRYGVLWAYYYEGEGAYVSGPTQAYIWGDQEIGFHFCPTCGCMAYWRSLTVNKEGRRRIGLNLRMADPDAVARIPIERLDGLNNFEELPRDGRCVADYWY